MLLLQDRDARLSNSALVQVFPFDVTAFFLDLSLPQIEVKRPLD